MLNKIQFDFLMEYMNHYVTYGSSNFNSETDKELWEKYCESIDNNYPLALKNFIDIKGLLDPLK